MDGEQIQTLEKFWSTSQVAAALGVSEPSVRRAIQRGDLRAVRVGKLFRISDSALRDFLRKIQAEYGVAKTAEIKK